MLPEWNYVVGKYFFLLLIYCKNKYKNKYSVPSIIKLIVLVFTNEAIQKLLDFSVLCFLFIFYAIPTFFILVMKLLL